MNDPSIAAERHVAAIAHEDTMKNLEAISISPHLNVDVLTHPSWSLSVLLEEAWPAEVREY